MRTGKIKTKRGAEVRVLEEGSGAPLVFLHGAAGLLPQNPFLERLAQRYHVYAPELPGYGESTGDDLLEDMLDFALHGWDVVSELDLDKPHLVGHSMGGMIAAEMACVAPKDVAKLVLVGPTGLWLPEHPIPDLFATLPFEFPRLLFHDPVAGAAQLTGGLDFTDMQAVADFYIANSRQMAMAGKILFPIPNRRLSKRLYRLTAPTLLVWGASDKLIPPVYAEKWKELLPSAKLETISEAGHMVPYEQGEKFVAAVERFIGEAVSR